LKDWTNSDNLCTMTPQNIFKMGKMAVEQMMLATKVKAPQN
jgi:hypothetical protein